MGNKEARSGVAKRIGGAIRSLRQQRGWSQEQLAEKASLTKGNVSGYERGASDMYVSTLERLLTALDVDFGDLADELGQPGELRRISLDQQEIRTLLVEIREAQREARKSETG